MSQAAVSGPRLVDSEEIQEPGILDRFPLGIIRWRWEPDGLAPGFRLREANRAASELVGFDLGPHVGERIEVVFPGEGIEDLTERWRAQLLENRTGELHRFSYGDSRVSRSHFETRTFPVGREEIMVLFDNATARVELEQRQNALERLNSLGRLAGGVAHDFNNILTVILSNVEMLLGLATLDRQAARDAKAIRDAARRGASLTRNLLTISKRQPLQPYWVEVNDRLRGYADFFGQVLGPAIEIRCELTEAPTPVWVDPVQLDQVFLNLLTNARDALPGGGSVSVRTAVVEVTELYAAEHPPLKPGPHVTVAFEDDGYGMDADTANHVFEPFFTTKGDSGNGIGLATVYGILTRAGGHIAVRSQPGSGTCFDLFIPLGSPPTLEPMSTSPASPCSPPPEKRGTDRVALVIDDEPGIRRAVSRVLRGAGGWTVLLAQDAEEALTLWREHRASVDVVLTDVRLPRVGGSEIVECLEAEGLRVPIVFMSGYSDVGSMDESRANPTRSFLLKPFEPKTLLTLLREMVGDTEP